MIHSHSGIRTGVDMLYHFSKLRRIDSLRTICHVIFGLFLTLLLLVGGQLFRQLTAQEPEIPEVHPADDAQLSEELPPNYPGRKYRNAFDSAITRSRQAIENEPHDAENYLALADAHIMLWCFGFVPHEQALPAAKAAVQQALRLNEQLAGAHTALGVVHMSERNWSDAEREFCLALKWEPERALSHHWYALFLAAMGRHAEALAESQTAVTFDPSPGMQTGLGAILYFGHDFKRMIKQMRSVTETDASFAPGYDWLGMAYVQEHRFAESIAAYLQAVDHSDGLAEMVAGLGHAYAIAGKHQEARAILAQLNDMSHKWYIPPVQIAYVYVGLGEIDPAVELLERAYREKSWELAFLNVEPWFDDIRSNPRFSDIVSRLNFPDPPEAVPEKP